MAAAAVAWCAPPASTAAVLCLEVAPPSRQLVFSILFPHYFPRWAVFPPPPVWMDMGTGYQYRTTVPSTDMGTVRYLVPGTG